MPDRAMELRHLAQADRHISEGEQRVLVMEAVIARAVALRMNTDTAHDLLALIVVGLANCKAHRLMILQAIDDIDRRKLEQTEVTAKGRRGFSPLEETATFPAR